jgi:hypothetical protein
MLQTLALTAALSLAPAQNAPLALTNERLTFGGEFGPTRPNNKLLPGDIFFLAFDIENLKLDPRGQVQYSIGMDVTDSSGKAIYGQKPADQEMLLPLGGSKLPARAFVILRPDQAKGVYNCRVTVTDRMTKASATLEKSFEVLPPSFGIVCVVTTVDEMGDIPAPMVGIAGQPLWLHFIVVGFGRDAAKQPNATAEVRVYDASGKPTTEQPVVYKYDKGVDEKVDGLPFKVPMPMNRTGTFTVEVKTECKVTGQNYKISFPINVLPQSK